MGMEDRIILDIRAELASSVDERTKNNFRRFFKEEFRFYGVKNPDAEKIAKKHFEKLRGKSKGEVFRICEKLLQSGFHEEAIVAFAWAYSLRKQYEADDLSVFERWVKDTSTTGPSATPSATTLWVRLSNASRNA
jgi:3-methyladenine DNA glycosylase AlkD